MSITAEDMRLLMERENKRQFESVTRVWYREKEQGRKPYRAIEEIGREEFGYSDEEAYAISHSAKSKVRRGKSSSEAVAEVKARWETSNVEHRTSNVEQENAELLQKAA